MHFTQVLLFLLQLGVASISVSDLKTYLRKCDHLQWSFLYYIYIFNFCITFRPNKKRIVSQALSHLF